MAKILRAVKASLGVRRTCPVGHQWFIYKRL
jgi:hypothetical protein